MRAVASLSWEILALVRAIALGTLTLVLCRLESLLARLRDLFGRVEP